MATNNRFITSYNGLTGVYYPSESGLVDIRSGQPYVGGGLYLGATTELTTAEAMSLTPPGGAFPVYGGRYRFVQIDPGATAANLGFGKIAGWAQGTQVQQVAILTAGSGQTAGSYTATASAGGAVIQYTINGSGALASVSVLSGGSYLSSASIPTFTIAAGGTPGTVVALMSTNPDVITSFDVAVGYGTLASTPTRGVLLGGPPTSTDLANPAYCWILEAGKANVAGSTSIGTTPIAGAWVNPTATGLVTGATANAYGVSTVGYALDIPQQSASTSLLAYFRANVTLPNFGG
jgi:hypothetical protein